MSDLKRILELIDAYYWYHKDKPKGTLIDGVLQKHPVYGRIAALQRNGLYDYALAVWQGNRRLPSPPNTTEDPDTDILNLKKWAVKLSGQNLKRKRSKTRLTAINDFIAPYLDRDPYLTCRHLGGVARCSPSTIIKTRAWKLNQKRRIKQKTKTRRLGDSLKLLGVDSNGQAELEIEEFKEKYFK